MRLVPKDAVPDAQRLDELGALRLVMQEHARTVDAYPRRRGAKLSKYVRAIELLRALTENFKRCVPAASRAELDALGADVVAFATYVTTELARPRAARATKRRPVPAISPANVVRLHETRRSSG